MYDDNITKEEIEKAINQHHRNDTLTSEDQTKIPEYDVKETMEGTEYGSGYGGTENGHENYWEAP